jgi:hypothetical protein
LSIIYKLFFKQKTIYFLYFYDVISLPRNFRFIDFHISPKILTFLDTLWSESMWEKVLLFARPLNSQMECICTPGIFSCGISGTPFAELNLTLWRYVAHICYHFKSFKTLFFKKNSMLCHAQINYELSGVNHLSVGLILAEISFQ